MKKIDKLRQQLLDMVKPHTPCKDEYKRAVGAKTEEELLKVIYDNINWCSERKFLTNEYFAQFSEKKFKASGITNTGKENTGFINSGYRNSGNWNSGNSNSGDRNSGDRNSGDRNSGNWNSGDSNSGDRNSGNWNSGYRNSGDSNSGNWNSGNWNSGYRNSGDRNSGDSNSGNWNSGDRNSGDSNSGYRNSGAFCTFNDPLMWLFDKPCKSMTVRQWEQTKACQLMYSIDPTVWVQWSAMSDEEKKANPKYEASEGYTKSIPMKEAWANAWGNWSDENKALLTSLENFDAKIFEEITGIKV